jgi:tripartite-type tricarboxylate transporter receptor subunit TctC
MGHVGTLAVNPWLYPKLSYDPLTSFAAVGGVARVPNVLVVASTSAVRSLKDLVELARRQPGRLTYSSGGNGSAAHITFEALKLRAQMPFVHIPYRGTVPSVTDLLGGQVDATFTGVTVLLPHIRSGRLRALAVSSAQRLPALPDVPTVAESGYPGFEADQWYGLVAPAATPAARVQQLNAELNRALAQPAVAQQLAGEAAIPLATTPQAFRAMIERELPRWGAVVKAASLKAD